MTQNGSGFRVLWWIIRDLRMKLGFNNGFGSHMIIYPGKLHTHSRESRKKILTSSKSHALKQDFSRIILSSLKYNHTSKIYRKHLHAPHGQIRRNQI